MADALQAGRYELEMPPLSDALGLETVGPWIGLKRPSPYEQQSNQSVIGSSKPNGGIVPLTCGCVDRLGE